MSVLLAIEGGDGAGKATAAAETADQLRALGLTATVVSFPRYRDTVGGHVLGEFLAGRLGRAVSPEAAAVLYALDRLESRDMLLAARAAHDVVVLDRYIASNMAYQAAKVPADERLPLMRWVLALETGQFALPPADLSIYLDTPVEVARGLIRRKQQRSYTSRTFDQHEADDRLQRAVRDNYAAMVEGQLGGEWRRVAMIEGNGLRTPKAVGAAIVAAVLASFGQ